MDKIKLEDIKLFGYHGCLDEEGKIGTDYRVNITVWGDLSKPARTDELGDTLDYVVIYRIVKEEVAIRSKLIENVAMRILDRLLNEMPEVKKAKVKLSKLHPPINGDVERVSVILIKER